MRPRQMLFAAIAATFLSVQSGTAQTAGKPKPPNLELTVDLTGIPDTLDKVYLSYYNTTTKFRFNDSLALKNNGPVVFRTHLSEPILAQLRVVRKGTADPADARRAFLRDNYNIYIQPGRIVVVAKDSLGGATARGSKTHQDYLQLKADLAAFDPKFEELRGQYGAARKSKDSVSEAAIRTQLNALQDSVTETVYKGFVKKHGKTSPVALYALSQYTGYSIDPVKAQPVYDLLGPSVRNLPTARLFQQRINIARQLQIGKPAIVFTQNDTLGKPVSLASFKGKYVLVDFWASWCGPCRAENPNVVKAFNKYKDRGFTVLGVSLDRPGHQEKWMKAIHDDQLTWTHVSDLKFWDNEVAQLYDIKAIPQNVLLDQEGKIVAKNIRGDDLETALHQLVK